VRLSRAGIGAVLLTLSSFVGCGGDDERPRPLGTAGDTAADGGRGGRAGLGGSAGSSQLAGAPNEAGASAQPGDAGSGGVEAGAGGADAVGGTGNGGRAGSDSGGTATGGMATGGTAGTAMLPCETDLDPTRPPSGSFVCDPSAEWEEDPVAIAVPGEGGEQLIGVTPDELTLVWSAALGPSRQFFVADRASSEETFEMSEALLESDVLFVSPDGLSLAVTSDSRDRLLERRRPSRGELFAEAVDGAFAELNARAADNLSNFGSAVVSPDGLTLYYTEFGPEPSTHPLRVSVREDVDSPWPLGGAVEACEFETLDAQAYAPSGVSADGLTLFYEDDVRGVSRAAYRAEPRGAFAHFEELGPRVRVQPNLACDRLYFSEPGSPGISFVSRAP